MAWPTGHYVYFVQAAVCLEAKLCRGEDEWTSDWNCLTKDSYLSKNSFLYDTSC